jgi:hypothetical protein
MLIMAQENSITQLHNTTPQLLAELLTENMIQRVKTQLEEIKKQLEHGTSEKYLTRIQTAKMLSISLTCLNDWGKKKIVHPLKMGNRTYFRLSDIENTLNSSNTL